MSAKPVVVGVDASSESARAGALGASLAEAAHTSCHLIHAATNPWTVLPSAADAAEAANAAERRYAQERQAIQHALWGHVPARALEQLSIRSGRPAIALRQAAAEVDAGLIVVGGKHHTRVGEWMGRSTAMDLLRTTELPVLVTASAALPRRMLVALDVSAATCPTLEAAVQYAELCGAKLKVVSVVEPLPTIGEAPALDPEPYYEASQALIEKDVWPMVDRSIEREVAFGLAADTVVRAARAWSADWLVVGSHGKGWFERVLVGSVTEQLVHALPAALLIVPVFSALVASPGRPQSAAAWLTHPPEGVCSPL